MQQLHLVGLTTDLDSIICSARKGAKSGSFVLPLNEHLLQASAYQAKENPPALAPVSPSPAARASKPLRKPRGASK